MIIDNDKLMRFDLVCRRCDGTHTSLYVLVSGDDAERLELECEDCRQNEVVQI